jgi:hypothetical protein
VPAHLYGGYRFPEEIISGVHKKAGAQLDFIHFKAGRLNFAFSGGYLDSAG